MKPMQSVPPQEPFWKDEPDAPAQLPPHYGVLRFSVILFQKAVTLMIIGATFLAFYVFSHILAWAWLVLMLSLYAWASYAGRRKRLSQRNIPEIQARARLQAGASLIGSAIHVAGHPLLEREQPVVLALAPDGLKLFSYADAHPIDIISLDQLAAVQTVVYDDERVPHVDVIDSAAQALQLTVKYPQREFTCLFRRMRKVRPIDWYHELMKAQWQGKH